MKTLFKRIMVLRYFGVICRMRETACSFLKELHVLTAHLHVSPP
jgi:hypothetical protein